MLIPVRPVEGRVAAPVYSVSPETRNLRPEI